jgi:hypothetical protein
MGVKNKSSQYRGVVFKPNIRKYQARIRVKNNGEVISKHLGYFPPTPEGEREAAITYDKMAIHYGMDTNILKKMAQ